jgi:hypothetical protein
MEMCRTKKACINKARRRPLSTMDNVEGESYASIRAVGGGGFHFVTGCGVYISDIERSGAPKYARNTASEAC